ncbi:hypothetical protein K440DRAFT_641412 [Wilcoxina mikolae CBS 423.85]|nr:hypothetical protein K440DRAFT_641412 [Wilcoxina mikolae CBS 423.85]
MPWDGRCDAPSTDGCSGGPVLDREGQVVGMFKGQKGDIDGVFITSEGSLHTLLIIKGPSVTWKDWGLKAVVGSASPSSEREGAGENSSLRKTRASEEDELKRKQHATSMQKHKSSTRRRARGINSIPSRSHHGNHRCWS